MGILRKNAVRTCLYVYGISPLSLKRGKLTNSHFAYKSNHTSNFEWRLLFAHEQTLQVLTKTDCSGRLCRLLDYVDCFVRHGIGALRNLGFLRLM